MAREKELWLSLGGIFFVGPVWSFFFKLFFVVFCFVLFFCCFCGFSSILVELMCLGRWALEVTDHMILYMIFTLLLGFKDVGIANRPLKGKLWEVSTLFCFSGDFCSLRPYVPFTDDFFFF